MGSLFLGHSLLPCRSLHPLTTGDFLKASTEGNTVVIRPDVWSYSLNSRERDQVLSATPYSDAAWRVPPIHSSNWLFTFPITVSLYVLILSSSFYLGVSLCSSIFLLSPPRSSWLAFLLTLFRAAPFHSSILHVPFALHTSITVSLLSFPSYLVVSVHSFLFSLTSLRSLMVLFLLIPSFLFTFPSLPFLRL